MASNTENLNLLMKNPSTDGADTFNVQTMLNDNWQKIDNNAGTVAQTLANILKPTTPPIIGLPPSTTPDGMFQALGNTGDLHVWRKTVTTTQEIPAKYELESAKETLISTRAEYGSGTQRIIVEYASSCSVSESGDPYLVNSSSTILEATSSTAITSLNNLKGKFLKFSKDSSYQYVTVIDGIFFIPSDATFRLESGPYRIFADKAQKVTGYAKVPAGTTITYPVSTNPNAYQEGSNAKPAGYTFEYLGKLGDKARVQVVSYVGTGTYGNRNPNSLTFDFVPKMVIISSAPVNNSCVYIAIMVPDTGIYSVVISTVFGYESRTPGGSGTVTKNNKTITFYSVSEAIQLNISGIKYTAIAIS